MTRITGSRPNRGMPTYEDLEEMREKQKRESGTGKRVLRYILYGLGGLVAIFLLIFLINCFYSVDEQHNAIVTQFGQIVKVSTAGFYFKAPWQSVNKVDMTTHGTSIGYVIEDDGQKGSYPVDEANGIMITSDFNLLNIDFYIEYRVSDPVAYVYNSKDPEGVLRNIALANIRTIVSNYTVDEAMTTGKNQIQADIKSAILESLENRNLGLSVVNITIQDSRPPVESVESAFKAVETAKQGADTAMNNALQYQNSQIPAADAKADAIIQQAEAKKTSRIAEATGQVERFNQMYEQYKQFPYTTKKRLFYEKLEEVLPGCKIIITDGGTETMYPLESFTSGSDNIVVTEGGEQ